MKIKEYDCQVVRLWDINQIMLYVSNGVLPIDEYVSKKGNGNPILIQVFKKEDTMELYAKYRRKQLDFLDVFNI